MRSLRGGRRHPGADGMGRPALGRSDDVGNAGHADRAGADGGAAGRFDLSAGIDAALAATLAHVLRRRSWSNVTSADLNLVAICCMTSGVYVSSGMHRGVRPRIDDLL
jgi:hypothetical protein